MTTRYCRHGFEAWLPQIQPEDVCEACSRERLEFHEPPCPDRRYHPEDKESECAPI